MYGPYILVKKSSVDIKMKTVWVDIPAVDLRSDRQKKRDNRRGIQGPQPLKVSYKSFSGFEKLHIYTRQEVEELVEKAKPKRQRELEKTPEDIPNSSQKTNRKETQELEAELAKRLEELDELTKSVTDIVSKYDSSINPEDISGVVEGLKVEAESGIEREDPDPISAFSAKPFFLDYSRDNWKLVKELQYLKDGGLIDEEEFAIRLAKIEKIDKRDL
tara:strand:- start:56 stop:706 length:651 start_codon:yes stop_codon:yes gene_type:complete